MKMEQTNDGYGCVENYKSLDGYGIIYEAKFPNGKIYIGQTICSLWLRIRGHINKAYNKKSSIYNCKIGRAIRKYSENNIVWKILCVVPVENLDAYEMSEINRKNSIKTGYNTVLGGGGIRGFKHSKAAKEKISIRSKQMCGEKSGSSKVKWDYVNCIRNDYLSGTMTYNELSNKYNKIAYSTIVDIIRNTRWKDDVYANKLLKKRSKKLNVDLVKEIRQRYCAKEIKLKDISKEYGISLGCANNIIRNKVWKDKLYDTELADRITKINANSTRFKHL